MSTIESLDRTTPGDSGGGLPRILALQRDAFIADGFPSAEIRRHRIDRLVALMLDNADALVDALVRDFGSKSRLGTMSMEFVGIIDAIEHTRAHVAKWMRTAPLMRAGRLAGLRAEVVPSPLGVVGIIGPWNFPLHLVIMPAAAAFAAGNRVMIKMSEITPATSDLFASLAPKYFDEAELAVVTGGADVGAAFSALPLDHLFFTGSPGVGKQIQAAAAQNLVPVTLELGGKNPVVVGPRAHVERAAERVALGRMVNGGQVCICPDYVMVHENEAERFSTAVLSAWRKRFPTMITNPEYPSCVNPANYGRVVHLIDDARSRGAVVQSVAPSGERLPDPETRKIPPTLVSCVSDDMRITQEEIFGPALMLLTYRDLSEVADYVNTHPSPLVAYWFGPDDEDFRRFVRSTRTGGVARNEFGIHMLPAAAPFGGVGNSGMGAYHGKAGFDTFSHHRSVVGTDLPFMLATSSAVPPFGWVPRAIVSLTMRIARRRSAKRLRGNILY
ncbi:aldehyde dehydrogenase family protein [Rhodococcus sp. HNM0563]|nr:aldehyde dehydrogenase family protein [Rhodococcus sp. HNM0563]NLU64122.1 aldehyde dehydrogenase family protein [Rhodococcus sp. HNM0563]